MKKIFYLIAITVVFFTSCNPMEDIYTEFDNLPSANNDIIGDVTYELTGDDYTKKKDKGGFLELSHESFSTIDEAKTLLPDFLTGTYPTWGVEYEDETGKPKVKSSANITFKWYNPRKTEKSLEVYTVKGSDYDELGFTYGNFSSMNNIITFLDWKYPTPTDRMLVSLKYKYYSGSVNTLKNGFIYVNGSWNFLQGFVETEYNAMGENYANFTSKTTALSRIPIYLKDYYKYESKEAGNIEGIMYNIYQKDYDDIDGDGSTTDKTTYSYVVYFIYDGNSWSKYNSIAKETIKFGHNGTTWVLDNTIKYTLTAADYDLVGNGNYGNFDVRSGKDDETVDARVAKINTILLNNFPSDVEGQEYVVFYNIYNGAAGVWSTKVIKSGAEYILNE